MVPLVFHIFAISEYLVPSNPERFSSGILWQRLKHRHILFLLGHISEVWSHQEECEAHVTNSRKSGCELHTTEYYRRFATLRFGKKKKNIRSIQWGIEEFSILLSSSLIIGFPGNPLLPPALPFPSRSLRASVCPVFYFAVVLVGGTVRNVLGCSTRNAACI